MAVRHGLFSFVVLAQASQIEKSARNYRKKPSIGVFCDMNRQQCDLVIGYVGPVMEPLGYECVEVEWDGSDQTLRIFIDSPAGIRMEDCLRVNDLLIEDSKLDALVPGDYRLEISSPGIERPLRTAQHFQKVLGQRIKVRLTERTESRVEGTGKLLGINQDDIVSLELPAGVWNFPIQAIRKASVVFDW